MASYVDSYKVPSVAALEGALTIDPSITNVGWAWWDGTDIPYTGVIKIKRSKKPLGLGARLTLLGVELKSMVFVLPYVDRVIVEEPEYWSGASDASVGSGSLMMLAISAGYIAATVQAYTNAEIHMVTPRCWKGNMSKSVVESRVDRVNGKSYRDHELDAVGIGFGIAKVL